MKKKYNKLESFIEFTGSFASNLFFLLVLFVTSSVLLRYLFSVGFTWLQDLYIWTHATIILLGIAYTLKKNEHVRIDLIYRNIKKSKKIIIDKFGSIFFGLPLSYFIFFEGFNYFNRSFILRESSKETGGLPAIYILKFFIFFLGLTLFVELIRFIFKKDDNK